MEIKTNTTNVNSAKIIPFPQPVDTTMMNWAQEKHEIQQRNNAAVEYSKNCRKEKLIDKDDVLCVLSCVSLMVFVASLYFLGAIFG